MFKKIAIAMTMGALSLTGCSVAPSTQGAADPAPAGASSSAAAPASSAAAGPEAGTAPETAPADAAADASPVEPPAPAAGTAPGTTPDAVAAAPGVPAAAAAPGAPAVGAPVAAPAPAIGAPAAPAPAVGAPAVGAPVAAPAPAPAPAPNQAAAATSGGTEAATTFGWGPVVAGDEFSNTGAPDATKWSVFNGAGHSGKGTRTPQAWSVANGVATVSGDTAGATGGMSAKFAQQQYGRWETRMKTNARDPKYHPVLILWPNNNASTNCAEIDYAEGSSDTSLMKFFLHYACSGGSFQTTAARPVDSTQWHNYAVEWTPAGITGFVDGVKTFTDTNPAHLPSVGMHQTLQLDWFPDGSATKASQMQVDWVRVYK